MTSPEITFPNPSFIALVGPFRVESEGGQDLFHLVVQLNRKPAGSGLLSWVE
jgi:hypothetical protein